MNGQIQANGKSKGAEPKVLQLEAIADEYDHDWEDVKNFAEDCDKNGQLREWLRPEQVELRKAIKLLMECGSDVTDYPFMYIANISKAYDNLKPPF